MFFDNHEFHKNAQLRSSLLWEYEIENIDWERMHDIVIQRVIERGRLDDFYALINLYGLNGVKEGIKNIPYLCAKDQSFVCSVFGLKKQELKCYTQKRLPSPL